MSQSKGNLLLPTWYQPDRAPVSCAENIKVLNKNLEEIQQMTQDALEDGILMGCDEAQLRDVLRRFINSPKNPYACSGEDKGPKT